MSKKNTKTLIISGIVIFTLILAYFLWWGFQTHEVVGKVSYIGWNHVTIQETWTNIKQSKVGTYRVIERPSVDPVNGRGEKAGEEDVTCMPATTVGMDGKLSFKEVNCTYITQTWKETKRKSISGTGKNTSWITLNPGRLDRIRYEFEYTVKIEYEEDGEIDIYTENPPDESLYKQWDIGDGVIMQKTNFGTISDIHKDY